MCSGDSRQLQCSVWCGGGFFRCPYILGLPLQCLCSVSESRVSKYCLPCLDVLLELRLFPCSPACCVSNLGSLCEGLLGHTWCHVRVSDIGKRLCSTAA